VAIKLVTPGTNDLVTMGLFALKLEFPYLSFTESVIY